MRKPIVCIECLPTQWRVGFCFDDSTPLFLFFYNRGEQEKRKAIRKGCEIQEAIRDKKLSSYFHKRGKDYITDKFYQTMFDLAVKWDNIKDDEMEVGNVCLAGSVEA